MLRTSASLKAQGSKNSSLVWWKWEVVYTLWETMPKATVCNTFYNLCILLSSLRGKGLRRLFTLELFFSISFSTWLSKWSLWFCHSLTSVPDTPSLRASPWWLFNQMNGQLQSWIEWVKHSGSCFFSFLLSLSIYSLSGNRWGFPQMYLLFEIIHTFC